LGVTKLARRSSQLPVEYRLKCHKTMPRAAVAARGTGLEQMLTLPTQRYDTVGVRPRASPTTAEIKNRIIVAMKNVTANPNIAPQG
jgi:hypothetical protein